MPMPTPATAAPLIKGYLPVRLRLPLSTTATRRGTEDDGSDHAQQQHQQQHEDTFFFLREHQGRSPQGVSPNAPGTDDGEDGTNGRAATTMPGTTLFVANAPAVPGISTKILLRSIFGRFADVVRITVVPNPRGGGGDGAPSTAGGVGAMTGSLSSFSFNTTIPLGFSGDDSFFYPTFLPPILSEGKYAHVVFASPKELKKAKRALEDIMSGRSQKKRGGKKRRSTGSNNDDDDDVVGEDSTILSPGLSLDKIEIQTLADESLRLWEENRRNVLRAGGDNSDDDDDDGGIGSIRRPDAPSPNKRPTPTGLLAVAERYRQSCNALSRDRLLRECDSIMEAYEVAEEAKRRAQEVARTQPDDDGFVTVTYSGGAAAVGSKAELEESLTATTPSRRKGNKRTRKKKDATGSTELKDFYRFQRRENRKRSMDDLRKQFDEDLKRVKRLKEEKQYRPF